MGLTVATVVAGDLWAAQSGRQTGQSRHALSRLSAYTGQCEAAADNFALTAPAIRLASAFAKRFTPPFRLVY